MEIYTPTADFASAATGSVGVDSIQINYSVGQVPKAQVTIHRNEGVRTPGGNDALQTLADHQARIDSAGNDPDTRIVLKDDGGGEIEFSGYLTAPSLSAGEGFSSEAARVVGADSGMMPLDLSIYSAGGESDRQSTSASKLLPIPAQSGGDVGAMLRSITETLVKNYSQTLAQEDTKSGKLFMAQQHAQNEGGALVAWYNFLDRSDVNYESWAELIAKWPPVGEAIANRTGTRIRQTPGSMWGMIQMLGNDFQMFYKPGLDGLGQFVRADSKVQNGVERPLSITRETLMDGSSVLRRLGGVVVMAQSPAGDRKEGADPRRNIAAQWPVELQPGNIHRTGPPVWMLMPHGRLPTTPLRAKPGSANLDLTQFETKAVAEDEKAAEVEVTLSDKVLQEYARVMYENLKGENSTASIQVPFDLTFEAGTRYNFTLADGLPFAAFCHSVSHHMQIAGSEPTCKTTLGLTHLQIG